MYVHYRHFAVLRFEAAGCVDGFEAVTLVHWCCSLTPIVRDSSQRRANNLTFGKRVLMLLLVLVSVAYPRHLASHIFYFFLTLNLFHCRWCLLAFLTAGALSTQRWLSCWGFLVWVCAQAMLLTVTKTRQDSEWERERGMEGGRERKAFGLIGW